MCPGSKAAPKTGSDGTGYDLSMNLNHKIIKPLPSLVSLKGEETYFKKWSGIRTDVILSLYEDDKLIKKEEGQAQLTDQGISGIVAFNISTHISRNLEKHKEKLKINFIPFIDNIDEWINTMTKLNLQIPEALERILNYKLANILFNQTKIKTKTFKNLNNEEKSKLIKTLREFELNIQSTGSFDKAQVCKGGIPLTEINLNTMESLKNKNLFFAGEIIDIDGDCGGYNLTIAWITGILAGENVWLE